MKPDLLSGVALRRRSGRRDGASNAESEQEGSQVRPGRPSVRGARQGGDPSGMSNEIVRGVLNGSGLGALSPIVAAEMVLNQAGVDPGALATDSNRKMGELLGGGVVEGGVSDLFHATENITGPLPEVAKKRIGGTLGGSAAPVLGTSVPDNGMSNVGFNPRRDQDGTERDPNSLGEVFNSLSGLSEGALDDLLLDAGQGLVQSLGQHGVFDLLSQMGLLPGEGEEGNAVRDLIGAVQQLPTDPAEILKTVTSEAGQILSEAAGGRGRGGAGGAGGPGPGAPTDEQAAAAADQEAVAAAETVHEDTASTDVAAPPGGPGGAAGANGAGEGRSGGGEEEAAMAAGQEEAAVEEAAMGGAGQAPGGAVAAMTPTAPVAPAPVELQRQSAPTPTRSGGSGGSGSGGTSRRAAPPTGGAPRQGSPPRTEVPVGARPQLPTPPGSGGGPGYDSPIPSDTSKMASPAAEEMTDGEQQDVNIDLQMNLAVPPELQGGGGGEPPAHDCDTGAAPPASNVGQAMMPENTYDPATGQAGPIAASPSGDALVSSGVNPAAGAGPVAVNPASGTVAGQGTASGGESASPEVQQGLNPASGQVMPTQPGFQATAAQAPTNGAQLGAVDGGAGGGGGGTIPQGSVPNVSYPGGSGEHLPSPDAPDVPQDFATGGGQQAAQQMQQDAQQMQTVQPAVDAQQQSEVAPKEQQGDQSIWDQILSFLSGLGLYDAQAADTSAQADGKRQQAAQSTQALVADANTQQQAQLAQQAGQPIPAELQQRGQTYTQAVTAAEANAVSTWSGGPQTRFPAGAQQAIDGGGQRVQQMSAAAQAPDLQSSVGAVQLPEHGLDPVAFDEVVDPSLQQFDASQIPQSPTPFPGGGGGGGGGGDAVGAIQADVNGQVTGEVMAYQQQLISEQTSRATSSYEQSVGETSDCYQGSVDRANEAIGQYEAADVQAEVAPFDAQAQSAFQAAQSESQAAICQMDSGFSAQQDTFDSCLVDAQGTFQGEVTDARGVHSGAVNEAGTSYDRSVADAETQMRTGHDQAMGTYQNTTTAATEGAQQTFDQEHAAAQQAVTGHQSSFDAQYATYRSDADGAGSQARDMFRSEFTAEQQRMQQATQQQIASTQGRVDSEMRSGQQQVDQHLRQGQTDAQRTMDQGQAQADAERNRAQGEADRQMAEAQNAKDDKNVFEKIGDAIASAISSALDWIKERFEEAKNAIVGFLERARDAALGMLEAARNLALSVLDRVKGMIQGLISALADVLRSFISAVASFLSSLIDWALQWILEQIRALTALIQSAIQAFQDIVNAVVEGLIAAVALIDQDLANKLQSAADVFLDRFNSVCDTVQAAVQSASDSLQSGIQAAGDQLKGAIESAEQSLLSAVDSAEAALHQGVDAVYNVAVDAVNTAFDTASDLVNTAFDLAEAAVVFLIDTVYAAIELAATELANHIQEVFSAIGAVASWVVQNIVAPLINFLKDPWTALRSMWVDFWNGPWRDILLGVALIALATVVCVATGGLGLVAMIAITAAVTGAAAAVTYGAGEMAARRANVSLVEEGHQTWKGASMIDPKSGEMVPDPRDPSNAWYLDTLGSISSNPDGSMSYHDKDGNLVTLTQDQLANDPSAVVAMMDQGLARGEDGQLTGESMGDSVRGAGALAADKGIEWTINGAVTAGTMGMGNYLTAAAQAGKIGMATSTVLRTGGSAALQSTADLVSGPISDSVGEMISDGKGFGEAWDQSWKYTSVADVTKAWGTSFVSNVAGEVISNKYSRIGHVNTQSGLGRTAKDAAEGLTSSAATVVINNASDVMFDGDPNTGWQTFWEKTASPDTMNQLIQGTVQNSLASRANDVATNRGNRIRQDIDARLGARGTQVYDRAMVAEGMDPKTGLPVEAGAGPGTPVRQTDDAVTADAPLVVRPVADRDPLSVTGDPNQTMPHGTPRDATVATSDAPAPVKGNAAVVQGSAFRGDTSATPVQRRDVHEGLRSFRESSGLSKNEFKFTDSSDGQQALLRVPSDTAEGGKRDVAVKIEVVDPKTNQDHLQGEHGVAAAGFVKNADGSYTLRLSSGTDPNHISRALAHEMAEIRFLERTGGGQDSTGAGSMDATKTPTGRMTAHDAGRMAEVATLLADLDRLKPTKPDQEGSPRFKETQAELDLLLQQSGLAQNNLSGRERMQILRREAEAGNLPPGVASRIEKHLAPQLGVDLAATQTKLNDFSNALFTGRDFANPDALLKAVRGMDEHQAKAFKDLLAEERGITPQQLEAHLKGRLHPADYQEAMSHLSGNTYDGSVAALQNMMRDDALADAGKLRGKEIEGESPSLVPSLLLHGGTAAKNAWRRKWSDPAGAVDVLAGMTTTDRAKLLKDPDGAAMLTRLGEDIPADGPVRRQWDALTSAQKKNETTEQWQTRGRAEYLLGHIEHQLQTEGNLLDRSLKKNREGALNELELLRNDPDLYAQVLKSIKDRSEPGSEGRKDPRKALEDLLTSGLDGKNDRTQAQIAEMKVKLDQADLDGQHRPVVKAIRDAGLPLENGAQLHEIAQLGNDPVHRARLEQALGGPEAVKNLMDYANKRRVLEHQERAHEVMAAVKDKRFDEMFTLLSDPTGAQLKKKVADETLPQGDRDFAAWQLQVWQKDRENLVATLKQVGGADIDQLGQQLHKGLFATGGSLSRLLGSGTDVATFREKMLPRLAAEGSLPPSDHLYLAIVGGNPDPVMATAALKGRSPGEIAQLAADFRRDFGDKYPKQLRAAGAQGDDVAFLRSVVEKEFSGRGRFDALRMLHGDPDAVFDPKAQYADEPTRVARAKERLELEQTLLRESMDFEGKAGGLAGNKLLRGGDGSSTDQLAARHQAAEDFAKVHKAALESGDARAWDSYRALRQSYDAAAAHNDAQRKRSAGTVGKVAGTAIGTTAGLASSALLAPILGPGALLAGKVIGAGVGTATKIFGGHMMDPTRTRGQDRADLVGGVAGMAGSALPISDLMGDTSGIAGKVGGGMISGSAKRGTEYSDDWRNSQRGTNLRKSLFSEGLQSIFAGTVGAAGSGAGKLLTGGGAGAVVAEQPLVFNKDAGKETSETVAGNIVRGRGASTKGKGDKKKTKGARDLGEFEPAAR